MAPVQGSKQSRGAAKHRGSDNKDSVPPGSQSSGEEKVAKLAEKMKKDTRGRREKRRTDISNAYRKSIKDIEDSMTAKFVDIISRMTDRHRRRLERLQDLIKIRMTIEARMLASIKNIENAFNFADKALSSALARRIQILAAY